MFPGTRIRCSSARAARESSSISLTKNSPSHNQYSGHAFKFLPILGRVSLPLSSRIFHPIICICHVQNLTFGGNSTSRTRSSACRISSRTFGNGALRRRGRRIMGCRKGRVVIGCFRRLKWLIVVSSSILLFLYSSVWFFNGGWLICCCSSWLQAYSGERRKFTRVWQLTALVATARDALSHFLVHNWVKWMEYIVTVLDSLKMYTFVLVRLWLFSAISPI